MVRLGIIGYGYWGPKLARNFSARPDCTVAAIADIRPECRELATSAYPAAQWYADGLALIGRDDLDAIAIATPVHTHFDLARAALETGKHVLLEKPMAATSAEARALDALARERNSILLVDHTFLYTGAVRKIRELIVTGEMGALQYFDSTRINLGMFQPDVNVLWDLASHDIAILNYLVADRPFSVQATGISHTHNGLENIAYLTLNYSGDFIAHFNCSWSSPVKIRMMLIGGDKRMLVFNDLEPTEKIRVYDTGSRIRNDEEKNRLLVDYRMGDIYIPKIDSNEALADVAGDFIRAIREGKEPVSGAAAGMEVVHILEAAQESLKHKGAEIIL